MMDHDKPSVSLLSSQVNETLTGGFVAYAHRRKAQRGGEGESRTRTTRPIDHEDREPYRWPVRGKTGRADCVARRTATGTVCRDTPRIGEVGTAASPATPSNPRLAPVGPDGVDLAPAHAPLPSEPCAASPSEPVPLGARLIDATRIIRAHIDMGHRHRRGQRRPASILSSTSSSTPTLAIG